MRLDDDVVLGLVAEGGEGELDGLRREMGHNRTGQQNTECMTSASPLPQWHCVPSRPGHTGIVAREDRRQLDRR